jgi:histidine triad (HIT) family protein
MNNFKSDSLLSEAESLICFYHPHPEYSMHVLLVPKAPMKDLFQIETKNSILLWDLIATVHDLVEGMNLKESGYRLVVNGGKYQDFPQLHFHLISGNQNQLPYA